MRPGCGDARASFRATLSANGGEVNKRKAVGLRDIWAVIEASAERRLGRPLLMAYLFLALFGILVVGGSLIAMRIGRQ
jgi:hypothetical protein